MKTALHNKLGQALLQGNPTSRQSAGNAAINPVSEMPMVLTLDQLRPNPDNPRTGRNPRFAEIKSSIKARGLDSVPKVTKEPGSDFYIFSDGGNTRFEILSELWKETQDERFYRLHVLFKPWPGRLHCVIGHLAENEVRGELTFIEKAQGINKLRTLYEEQHGKKLSLRALSQCISEDGFPVSVSHISKMEETLTVLAPYMPTLLQAGLGRPQIEQLLSVRSILKRISESLIVLNTNAEQYFFECFKNTCSEIDAHDSFAFDIFLDELIGRLIRECSFAGFDYERWLFEFKVNKGKRGGKQDGNLLPVADMDINSSSDGYTDDEISHIVVNDKEQAAASTSTTGGGKTAPDEQESEACPSLVEIQDDLYGGEPVLSGDIADDDNKKGVVMLVNVTDCSIAESVNQPESFFPQTCHDIWPLAAHVNDIEHLQAQVWRTLFELGSELDLASFFMASSGVHSPGFIPTADNSALSCVMSAFSEEDEHLDEVSAALKRLLTGGYQPENQPVLNDAQFMMWMKLMYLLRCLYARQRSVDPDVGDDEEELE